MDQSYESLVSMGEFRPMVVSPHMSPQLNETICGCRCGCGCGCAGDGNVDESERLSDSETAIDSSESENGNNLPPSQYTPNDSAINNDSGRTSAGVLSPRAMSRQVIVWLLERPEDLQFSEALLFREQISAHPLLCDENEDRSTTLLGEPCSMEMRSNAITGQGNVQMVSPGPGIGGWLQMVPERTRVEQGQHVYIFTPLRLSAEFQHARGKMVEPILIPDEAYFQENLQ